MNWLEIAITLPRNWEVITIGLLKTVEAEYYMEDWLAWLVKNRN